MSKKRTLIRPFHWITPINVFIFGLTALLVMTFLRAARYDGMPLYTLLHSNWEDTFMDFFNSIYDAGFENPYVERGVIYPALTYLYYRFCGCYLPEGQSAAQWRDSLYGIILMLINTVVIFLALIHIMRSKDQKEKKSDLLLKLVLFGTVPFWYAIERGNLILVTLAFLTYFVVNYQSKNKYKRELALICLAISAATKIYPAYFGVLLILEKRYKEAFRCAIYGAVAIFLPFLFFGGMETIGVMVQNITNTSTAMAQNGYGYKLNIDNTLGFLQRFIPFSPLGMQMIKILLLLAMGYALIATQKLWQRCMILCSLMILIPGFSYTYTMIFVAIPLLMFFYEVPRTTTMNLLFSFLFLMMFTPFPFNGSGHISQHYYHMNLTTAVSSISIVAMNLLIVIDVWMSKHRKKSV